MLILMVLAPPAASGAQEPEAPVLSLEEAGAIALDNNRTVENDVLITVGATVRALIPLAVHGGPLWQPLCDAQTDGLSLATFIELLLVPILYAIFVLDLKVVAWRRSGPPEATG